MAAVAVNAQSPLSALGRVTAMARRRSRGFTLVELMIVVAIVAILAAIAYPAYRRSVLKSHRTDAKVSLTKLAQRLERCHSQFGTYNDGGCSVQPAGTGNSLDSDEGYYHITVKTTSGSFDLTAKPASKGAQTDDACTSFSLDETGTKGAAGPANAVTTCW